MSKQLLKATDICLSRQGQRLIDSVSVALYQEQTAVLLGHNGAGKTLLLQILHGLISADSGKIEHYLSTNQKMVFQKPIYCAALRFPIFNLPHKAMIQSWLIYGLKKQN